MEARHVGTGLDRGGSLQDWTSSGLLCWLLQSDESARRTVSRGLLSGLRSALGNLTMRVAGACRWAASCPPRCADWSPCAGRSDQQDRWTQYARRCHSETEDCACGNSSQHRALLDVGEVGISQPQSIRVTDRGSTGTTHPEPHRTNERSSMEISSVAVDHHPQTNKTDGSLESAQRMSIRSSSSDSIDQSEWNQHPQGSPPHPVRVG
jgi:hypothetical protein